MRTIMIQRLAAMFAAALAVTACATAKPLSTSELVWPAPPEQPRVRYVETFERRNHFGTKGSDRFKEALIGPETHNLLRFGKPLAVTADAKGRVYVTDTGGGAVWIFDREKQEVRILSGAGSVRLVTPAGVAVDARGVLFVSDTKHDRVFAFDEAGKLVMALGQPDEFYNPSGVAIDQRTGRIYIADTGHHRIRVYDTASGKFLFDISQRGTAPGFLNFPTHLFLRRGRLYVSDTGNFRVQTFDLDGKPLKTFGEIGAKLGQLARPKGVAADSEGHIYVVDAAFNNFQIFDQEGQLLLFVGQMGTGPGELWLPAGMHIDEQDRIYVVDQYNRRVQVFEYMGEVSLARAKQSNGGKQ